MLPAGGRDGCAQFAGTLAPHADKGTTYQIGVAVSAAISRLLIDVGR
jgi:hypothetical protein